MASLCVVDASIALPWCFEDEASPAADDLLARLAKDGATVPPLWHLDIADLLLAASGCQRITEARAAEFLALLDELPIETDSASPDRGRREVLHLARETGLCTHDAAYLELAMRRHLPLATRDPVLMRAALAVGVTTFPL
jgi:predicted nucleic acid-binding protein